MRRKFTPETDDLEPEGGVATLPDAGPEGDEPEEIALPSPQETAADPRALSIRARIVYLGNHPTRSAYLVGNVRDLTLPDGQVVHIPGFQKETAEIYVFARVDAQGHPLPPEDLMPAGAGPLAGRPYVWCHHIGHAVWFHRALGPDGGPEFRVLASAADGLKIRGFQVRQAERQARNQDHGAPVLAQMGLGG